MQEQAKTTQKTNKKLQMIEDSLSHIPMQTATNINLSYREALMNGTVSRPPALLPPANIHEARLQNRLSIEACQILVEIQAQETDPAHITTSTDPKLMGNLKITINKWLANSDVEDLPPPNSTVCAISEYHNNKLLIETNSHETAKWLKTNTTQVLQPLVGQLIKILGRLYQVVTSFMPVQFQTNEEGAQELKISANLPTESISHMTWLKNPEHRSPGQHCANVKIHCRSAEDANTLILSSR